MVIKSKFNDYPFISDDKNDIQKFDLIDISMFAESIAEFIRECETPITIGLQGDWGTGKTSLMNMVKCNLPDRKIHKIDINTWHYSMFRQDEYLGVIIVQTLIDELAKKMAGSNKEFAVNLEESSKKVNEVLRKVVNVAKSVSIGIPGGGISINDIKSAIQSVDDSMHIENISAVMLDFKNKFAKIVSDHVDVENNERIVFFIDDLDRIRPLKAIEVLETLKNFMDVEGCVFVLAVDYEIVQLGIAEKFGRDIQQTSGKSFFDKIIQLPFTMPTSSYNIEKYLSDLLKDSKFYGYKLEDNIADKDFFVNVTEVTVGRNPRSIKRAINYAALLERIRSKESKSGTKKDKETMKLLYAIVCMQIAWPELFEFFVLNPSPETVKRLEDWDFLDKLPHAKKLFARVANEEEVKDNIAAFFDLLYEQLDKDGSGIISDDELNPLLKVLMLVKLTSEKIIVKSENPLKTYKHKVIANARDDKKYSAFFDNVFMKTIWATTDDFNYKKAGERYFTIISSRKQIGSLVTLKSKPMLIRIKEDRDNMLRLLKEHPDYEIYESIIKDYDASITVAGIGDVTLDIDDLIALNDETKAKDILNKIAQVIKELQKCK